MGFIKNLFKSDPPVNKHEDKPEPVLAQKPKDNSPVVYKCVESPRKIRHELKEYIEKRITVRPAGTNEIVCLAAIALDGVSEKGGNNKGKEVEWMQDTIGDIGREAWCMSAVQSIVGYVEQLIGKKSSLAPSEHCLTVWHETPKERRVAVPSRGCVVIWRHGASSSGHTGIVLKVEGDSMTTLEGNTGPSNALVEREGDGCYIKKRSIHGAGDMKVVGYIKPF